MKRWTVMLITVFLTGCATTPPVLLSPWETPVLVLASCNRFVPAQVMNDAYWATARTNAGLGPRAVYVGPCPPSFITAVDVPKGWGRPPTAGFPEVPIPKPTAEAAAARPMWGYWMLVETPLSWIHEFAPGGPVAFTQLGPFETLAKCEMARDDISASTVMSVWTQCREYRP